MGVNATEDPARRLARRLRTLRTETWPDKHITQSDLAKAIRASEPLISSWEGRKALPPPRRLRAYATFFATERSVSRRPYRLINEAQLTEDERVRRDDLFGELTALRGSVHGQHGHGQQPAVPEGADPFAESQWRYPLGQDITIVCSALPPNKLNPMPFTDPDSPDYVSTYRFGEPDALLELYGHIRAANPLNKVRIRTSAEVRDDDYTSNLVLLGGVDWNSITAELLKRPDLPVRQLTRENDLVPGGFTVDQEGEEIMLSPTLRKVGEKEILVEDVAHFFRAVSPLNEKRTVTICNGNYQRGTLGAVRALTDPRFRDRNEAHLRARFAGQATYSILSRVRVILGNVVTPQWTNDDEVLHEWPGRVEPPGQLARP
jgi:transcriptional regulator with XRE-family HTH domain